MKKFRIYFWLGSWPNNRMRFIEWLAEDSSLAVAEFRRENPHVGSVYVITVQDEDGVAVKFSGSRGPVKNAVWTGSGSVQEKQNDL